jgi:hypothetical protein
MSCKPGDSVTVDFTTQDPGTGGATDADFLPTGTLVRNGSDTAESVTVINKETGVYKASVTIPAAYAAGDEVQVRINATVGGVAGKSVIWTTTLDAMRVADLLSVTPATIDTIVTGSEVTLHRGDTLTVSISGLGDISGRSKLWFAGKKRSQDTDDEAELLVEETGGLAVLAASTPVMGETASIIVDDDLAGDIRVIISAEAAKKLRPTTVGVWDVQMRDGTGIVTTLGHGELKIVADVTQRVD